MTVDAFFEAAQYAGAALASPMVAAAWDRESALPKMTVGAVAGHMFLVVRRVDKHLDEPEAIGVATPAPHDYRWLRVEREEDLERAEHQAVRADGDHVAAWGWEAVATAYVDRVRRLRERLALRRPQTVALPNTLMDFDAYLATRVVELLVHADDLAVSVGVTPPELPPAATTIAIDVLLNAARSIHGDLEILRALTRSERVRPPVPSVY
jgi:hypothetical protein